MAKILAEKPEPNQNNLSLSVSRIKCFTNCQAQYKYQYILKFAQKEYAHLEFGKFVHEVLENFHRKLIQDPSLMYNEVMTESHNAALKNYPNLSKESKLEGIQILGQYLKLLAKQKKEGTLPTVLSVEKNFFIGIDDTLLINGFIDRVSRDPKDDMITIGDYKTTKDKKYLKNDWLQLQTYSFVMMLENPDIKRIRGSYIMLRHGFEEITKEFERDEIMGPMEKKFLDYADKIRSEKLFRASPSPLCKGCSFLSNCESGQRFLGIVNSNYGQLEW